MSTNLLAEVPRERADARHRGRLVVGLLTSIEERGYAATTIADIVRHAKVSKRTFYEHFASKEEALRALYLHSVTSLNERYLAVMAPPGPWRDRIHAGIRAFVDGLNDYPGLARTVLIEIPVADPVTFSLRNEVHDGFAEAFVSLADVFRQDDPQLAPLSFDLATAIVGAMYELMIRSLRGGSLDADHIADIGTELMALVLTAPRD